MSVTWHAADRSAAATEVARAQPRVLVLQTELLPNLPLVASIARAGFEVVGPLNRISQALTRLEDDPPDAVILDIALRDGISFNLARELLRRKIPFLFYTSWGDMELIPPELREMPLLEKPMHFVLVAKLLSRMIKDGPPLGAQPW
jgi:two-component SAPR family response regulator